MQLKRQHSSSDEEDEKEGLDEGVADYDYDNPADAAEFCPGTQDDDVRSQVLVSLGRLNYIFTMGQSQGLSEILCHPDQFPPTVWSLMTN